MDFRQKSINLKFQNTWQMSRKLTVRRRTSDQKTNSLSNSGLVFNENKIPALITHPISYLTTNSHVLGKFCLPEIYIFFTSSFLFAWSNKSQLKHK